MVLMTDQPPVASQKGVFRMHRLIAVFSVLVLTSLPGFCQLTVVWTSPADEAVSVPVNTTLSITFSQPLDTNYVSPYGHARGALGLMIMSQGVVGTAGDYSYSEDLRTYQLQLELQPNRDFFFVIADARSTGGDSLMQFVPLRFSTASSRGERTVSGQVAFPSGDQSHTVVFLTESYPVIQPNMFDGSLGCLYDEANSRYQINNAVSGHHYWITALQVGGGVGSYDPNGDGHADSVVIGETDLTNIDISIHRLSANRGNPPSLPSEFRITEVYPNPFNPSTTISFDLPRAGHISLRVLDLLGREVAVLKDGFLETGTHAAIFDGSKLSSGIYFARLDAGEFSRTRKLVLLK
jgi:hypothetical protein